MANFFIGIGGTGQTVGLAYWRLMGLIPWCTPAEMYFMDKDAVTSSNNQTVATLIPNVRMIDPLPPAPGVRSFYDLFHDNNFSDDTKNMLSALFTSQEERTRISTGMYARPAVGASVLKAMLIMNVGNEYRQLMDKLNDGGQHNVVICGSSMGGTGAGGVPSIAQHISQNLEDSRSRNNVRIHIIYLLKHFTIQDIERDDDTVITRLQVIQNSESGLCYLADKIIKGVDTCLLMGLETLPLREYQDVGFQKEQSHFLHTLAALTVHNSQFPQTYMNSSSHVLYAYSLNKNGMAIDNIKFKFPDKTEMNLSQVFKMNIAVEEFLKYFRNLMIPLPGFSFWPVFPKKFTKALTALSRQLNRNRETVAENIGRLMLDESINIQKNVEFFKKVLKSRLPGETSGDVVDFDDSDISINSPNFEKTRKKPILFIRKWLHELGKNSNLSDIRTEEELSEEIKKALYRTVNKSFFSNTSNVYS